ncbi:hypothetical protein [Sphingobium sp.]|uniref:hypothetical protein n=1 Tax=Sphingobium sp. TaxID=1912891 RepID=UPI003BB8144F
MFFFDLQFNRWNVSEIVCISVPISLDGSDNKNGRNVELKNGKKVVIDERNFDNIDNFVLHTLPAKPDLLAIAYEDDEGIELKPVLAWALTAGGKCLPVTRDGVNDGGNGVMPIIDSTLKQDVVGFYKSLAHYHDSYETPESSTL